MESINGTVVLSRLKTESSLDFNCLSLVCLKDVTLLGTYKVLKWTGVLVVLESSTTENLRDWLIVDLEDFIEDELVNRPISELFHIPPEDTTVG